MSYNGGYVNYLGGGEWRPCQRALGGLVVMRLLRFLLLLVPALVLVLLVRGWSGRKSGSQAPRVPVVATDSDDEPRICPALCSVMVTPLPRSSNVFNRAGA